MSNNMNMTNFPKEKFQFAQKDERLHDVKFETKAIGYFKDAWMRFRKNKSAVVAAVFIVLLLLFAIIVPLSRSVYNSRWLLRDHALRARHSSSASRTAVKHTVKARLVMTLQGH